MVAALLSLLVPGLGQICQGRPLAGAGFILLDCIAAILGIALFPFGLALCGLVAFYAAIDAAVH